MVGAPYAGELFTFLAQVMFPYGMRWQMGAPPGLVPRSLNERCSGSHRDVSVWQTVATLMRVALHLHLVRPGLTGAVAPVRCVRVRLVVERMPASARGLGMIIWVWVSDTCQLSDLTDVGIRMIFYL
jgi:hypothetical protein